MHVSRIVVATSYDKYIIIKLHCDIIKDGRSIHLYMSGILADAMWKHNDIRHSIKHYFQVSRLNLQNFLKFAILEYIV